MEMKAIIGMKWTGNSEWGMEDREFQVQGQS